MGVAVVLEKNLADMARHWARTICVQGEARCTKKGAGKSPAPWEPRCATKIPRKHKPFDSPAVV
jgi:hypothetical protein